MAKKKVVLKLEKLEDGWWLTGSPDPEADTGPYRTKDEAVEDKKGLEHFWNTLWPPVEARLKSRG